VPQTSVLTNDLIDYIIILSILATEFLVLLLSSSTPICLKGIIALTMHNLNYLSRFLYILICIAVPIYLAIRGFASLFNTGFLLSSLSERAKALHVALASPLAAPLALNYKAAF